MGDFPTGAFDLQDVGPVDFLNQFHGGIGHIAGTNRLALNIRNLIGLVNGTLVASVAGNALTIAIKTRAGADPSATDPVIVMFRSATATTGDATAIALTAATSFVVSSGSTLGAANSTAFRLWVVAFNDAGTLRLGVVNTLSGTSIMPLAGWGIASSTAEGGAGAADSAQVFYTGAAVTSKAYTILGYLSFESGLGTAGTWSAGPTRIQLFTPGTPLPGTVIQRQRSASGTFATGTTVIPTDNTIPQNTEGDQYLSQAITPTSAANLLRIGVSSNFGASVLVNITMALFQDSVANALAANLMTAGGANYSEPLTLLHVMLAATASATTFKVRAGPGSAATTTFNGAAGAQYFGGVSNSYLEVEEVMR